VVFHDGVRKPSVAPLRSSHSVSIPAPDLLPDTSTRYSPFSGSHQILRSGSYLPVPFDTDCASRLTMVKASDNLRFFRVDFSPYRKSSSASPALPSRSHSRPEILQRVTRFYSHHHYRSYHPRAMVVKISTRVHPSTAIAAANRQSLPRSESTELLRDQRAREAVLGPLSEHLTQHHPN